MRFFCYNSVLMLFFFMLRILIIILDIFCRCMEEEGVKLVFIKYEEMCNFLS